MQYFHLPIHLGNILYNLQDYCMFLKEWYSCIFFIETYSIEDCSKYDSTNYTSSRNIDINLPTTPLAVEFKIKPTARSSSASNIKLGESSSNYVEIGQSGSDGTLYLQVFLNGTRTYVQGLNTKAPTTEYITVKYTYENGVHRLYGLNNESTSYNQQMTMNSAFYMGISNNNLKELKIKPL